MDKPQVDAPKPVTPKIANKVKFWEEQDRINTALIPRVLKQHELFTHHVEHHKDSSSAIAALEDRTLRRERRILIFAGSALVVAILSLILSVVL